MGLNKSKGNMYEFITHTWNTVKGACPHDCSYCYMKKWGKLNPVRFDEKELKTDLGSGNFIFVGSSCDMFAEEIPSEWIAKTLIKTWDANNKYLFQTKNPGRVDVKFLPENSILCTTIESDSYYPEIMNNAPEPIDRIKALKKLKNKIPIYITIEPIMDFDLNKLIAWMEVIEPKQINIGADSGGNNLPEPKTWKLKKLIIELNKITKVHTKSNLKRLL